MKKNHNIYLVIFFTISIISCKVGSDKYRQIVSNSKDTFITDVPDWAKSDGFSRHMMRRFNELLNLRSIEKGVDSLEIRIWIDCGYASSSLIVIKRESKIWNAVFYTFKFHLKGEADFELVDLKMRTVSPKSGWNYFSTLFFSTGVIDFPDHSKFAPKYNLPNDGNAITVEVATSNKYRIYSYPNLLININLKNDPAKMESVLKLLENEFEFNRPCEKKVKIN